MATGRDQADVDRWFAGRSAWQAELLELRRILLELGLEEGLKWRQPCYMVEGRNVLILASYKDGATLNFFQGALLRDPDGRLRTPGENTHAGRVLTLPSLEEIRALDDVVRAFVQEAMAHERAGRSVDPVGRKQTPVPAELTEVLAEDPELQAAFEALTPGRQRGYLIVLNQAKRPATRRARLLGFRDRILDGKGPNDCVCGRSKRMPGCDGTHKSPP